MTLPQLAQKFRNAAALSGVMFALVAVNFVHVSHAAPPPPTPVIQSGHLADAPATSFGWSSSASAIKARLTALQNEAKSLQKDFTNETASLGSESLSSLGERAANLTTSATAITSQVKSYQTVYESFLETIGATPTEGESEDLSTQRAQLKQTLADIRSAAIQSRLMELQGKQLSLDVQRRQAHQQTALLSQKLPSPVTPDFWSHQASEFSAVTTVFSAGAAGSYPGPLSKSWLWLLGLSIVGVAAAFTARATTAIVPKLEHSLMHRVGTAPKNERHPRYVSILVTGLLSAIVAALLWQLFLVTVYDGAGQQIAESLANSVPLAGFIIGAGPKLIDVMIGNPDDASRRSIGLHGSVFIIAGIVVLQSLIFAIAEDGALPFYTRHLLEGIYAVAVAAFLISFFRRMDDFRTEERLIFVPSLRGVTAMAGLVALVALLLGYMIFGFYVIANLVTIALGGVIVLLIGLATHELVAWIFGSKAPLARRLTLLGVGARRVEQCGVVLTFIANALLMILFLAVALSSGRFELGVIVDKLSGLFVGRSVHGFSLSLNTIFACLITLVVAYYIIRYVKKWLDTRLFPLTKLDVGTRSSILNILTYMLWIATILIVLTEAGVAVQNLTWVVSALSVGIGFGLQSIVQNFVSGVILLTERPIRVGDLVEIAGVKGDVKKISVRATEITLGDGSTMIVPNSQFITSNVRNATMGAPVSTTTATVTISTNADAAKAQRLLLEMMQQRTDILQDPAPSVSIASISETGITLAISAKLLSVRDAGGVTNAIMLDAYSLLRNKKIALGQPPAQFGGAATV